MWFVGLNCVADCCFTAGFVFYDVVCWCWLLVFVVGSCLRLVVGLIWFWVCCVVGGSLIWILLCLQVAGLVSGCCFVFVVVVAICFWSCVVWLVWYLCLGCCLFV